MSVTECCPPKFPCSIIIVESNGEDGYNFSFDNKNWCLIGSNKDCDIRIALSHVAPLHALVFVEKNSVYLQGIDKSLPVYHGQLNVELTSEKEIKLSPNDIFAIGDIIFKIVFGPQTRSSCTVPNSNRNSLLSSPMANSSIQKIKRRSSILIDQEGAQYILEKRNTGHLLTAAQLRRVSDAITLFESKQDFRTSNNLQRSLSDTLSDKFVERKAGLSFTQDNTSKALGRKLNSRSFDSDIKDVSELDLPLNSPNNTRRKFLQCNSNNRVAFSGKVLEAGAHYSPFRPTIAVLSPHSRIIGLETSALSGSIISKQQSSLKLRNESNSSESLKANRAISFDDDEGETVHPCSTGMRYHFQNGENRTKSTSLSSRSPVTRAGGVIHALFRKMSGSLSLQEDATASNFREMIEKHYSPEDCLIAYKDRQVLNARTFVNSSQNHEIQRTFAKEIIEKNELHPSNQKFLSPTINLSVNDSTRDTMKESSSESQDLRTKSLTSSLMCKGELEYKSSKISSRKSTEENVLDAAALLLDFSRSSRLSNEGHCRNFGQNYVESPKVGSTTDTLSTEKAPKTSPTTALEKFVAINGCNKSDGALIEQKPGLHNSSKYQPITPFRHSENSKDNDDIYCLREFCEETVKVKEREATVQVEDPDGKLRKRIEKILEYNIQMSPINPQFSISNSKISVKKNENQVVLENHNDNSFEMLSVTSENGQQESQKEEQIHKLNIEKKQEMNHERNEKSKRLYRSSEMSQQLKTLDKPSQELSHLNVADLRKKLKSLQLETKGVKQVLVTRLLDHYSKGNGRKNEVNVHMTRSKGKSAENWGAKNKVQGKRKELSEEDKISSSRKDTVHDFAISDYECKTVKELRGYLKKRNLNTQSKMRKRELIQHLILLGINADGKEK